MVTSLEPRDVWRVRDGLPARGGALQMMVQPIARFLPGDVGQDACLCLEPVLEIVARNAAVLFVEMIRVVPDFFVQELALGQRLSGFRFHGL